MRPNNPDKRCFTYCGEDRCDCGATEYIEAFANNRIIPYSQKDGDPMTPLSDLLARVEKATGRDWQLDRSLEALAGDDWYISNNQFTASLDAALALVERLFEADVQWIARIAVVAWAQIKEPVAGLPRHVLITLLKALIAREEGK